MKILTAHIHVVTSSSTARAIRSIARKRKISVSQFVRDVLKAAVEENEVIKE